jgi:hypothetical protein
LNGLPIWIPPTRGKLGGFQAKDVVLAASAMVAAAMSVPFLIESKSIFPPGR